MSTPIDYLAIIEARKNEIFAREVKDKQKAEDRLEEVNRKMIMLLDPVLQLFHQASKMKEIATNSIGPAIFCRNTGDYYYFCGDPYIQSTLDMPKYKGKVRVHCDLSGQGEIISVKLYSRYGADDKCILNSFDVGMDGIVSALIDFIVDMSRMNSN